MIYVDYKNEENMFMYEYTYCTMPYLDVIHVSCWYLLLILEDFDEIWWYMYINDDYDLGFYKYDDNHV